MSDLSEKLAAIEALEKEATPGPWTAEPYHYPDPEHGRVRITSPSDGGIYNTAEAMLASDAEFTATSREAVPFLLALVREQAAKLAKVTELIRDLTDPEPCSFDHHGGCQAHGYLSLQPGETCPQHDAKEWTP